jgi:hypothetical protein
MYSLFGPLHCSAGRLLLFASHQRSSTAPVDVFPLLLLQPCWTHLCQLVNVFPGASLRHMPSSLLYLMQFRGKLSVFHAINLTDG